MKQIKAAVSVAKKYLIKLEMERRRILEGSNIPSRDKENNNVRKGM
jgi:hypothetical protein